MTHRRSKKAPPHSESFIQLIFFLLLFLTVLRVIDLLPAANSDAEPAFSHSTPLPVPASNDTEEPAEEPVRENAPAAISQIEMTHLSHGLDLRGEAPKILIYHTHTTEAYTATASSPYVQTSSYRTADAGKSVLAVGEALAERLRTQYGFAVLHDTTDHEPPSLKTAYDRSERTMRKYLEQYPSLVLFIDVHRDASSDAKDYVVVDGSPTARLMCVVGQGTKYKDKPDFDRNYALAAKLTKNLRHIEKRLARDVRVKTGRYNQHVGQLSLLIEVGHNANTLEQALHAIPSLAESLALTLAETDAPEPVGENPSGLSLWIPAGAGIDKE